MNRRRFVQLAGFSAATLGTAPLQAMTQDHVIVAGAGILGASIAYHLARRGARVTVLEKERPAAGTTKNSFAWLNAAGKSPRSYYELNLAGMAGWRRLELEIGADKLPVQWGGGVQWCRPDDTEVAAMKAHVKERQGFGYSVDLIDKDNIARLIPGVVAGDVGAGNFADQEGTVDPVAAALAILAAARSLGAEVMYPCEVTDLRLADGRIRGVMTTQGPMQADYVVLATGNGTEALAAKAGMKVPLKESKGILAHSVPAPPALGRILMNGDCDVKQNHDGRIVTGANFGETGDLLATPELGSQYLETAARYLPRLKGAKLDYMTLGHRVMPEDGHPILGRSPRYPNFYVVAMHSGMTCSPIVGQLASIEVLDQVDVDMLADFRAARFA